MKRRGVSRKNSHTAAYQRYTYQHTAASGPDQPYGRERNRTGSSRDNYDVGSAPNHPIPAHRKLKMDARNVRRRQKRRAATEKAWYAVVKGANLGLYSKWEEVQEHIRLSLELDIRSPKAYRYKSRTLSLSRASYVSGTANASFPKRPRCVAEECSICLQNSCSSKGWPRRTP